MKKLKVMSIFGTRPEAIKMAPVVKELEKSQYIDSYVSVTAQHREMLDSVLNLFDIKPNYDLNIMKTGQSITDITSKVLYGIGEVFKSDRPDLVLVHGDTTTTFAASLAAFYAKIAVGHVEAGLRTYNVYSPYPEEMNRQLVSRIAKWHFAPTQNNYDNLIKENINPESITITGNTVIDALLHTTEKPYTFKNNLLNSFDKEHTILLTCHRRENWGKPMEEIFKAVHKIIDKYKDMKLVFPMHKNPLVREIAYKYLSDNPRIILIDPLDYQPFAYLMKNSHIILTDSGGIQEEAPSLGKPVLVLRTETERPEAIKSGTVALAGVTEESVFKACDRLLSDKKSYYEMAHAVNPYGDGTAAKRTVSFIENHADNVF